MTTPVLRGSTAPLPGRPDGTPFGQNTLQATSPDATLIGDLILAVTWQGTANTAVSVLTLRSGEGWTQLFNFLHDDGNNDGSFAAAWKIATQAGAQIYQAFNSTSPATDCRTALRVYSVNTFDSSGILASTPVSFPDGNIDPDPPSLSGLNGARNYLIEAIAGWYCSNGTVLVTPGAPSLYSNLIHTVDAGWLDLALSNREEPFGNTLANPATYTDNVSSTNNRGSVAATVAILGAPGTARRAIITQGELEVPDPAAERRAIITQAEFEVPNKKFPETLTYVFNRSWNRYKFQSTDPQPVGTRRAVITQAELEVPDATRRAIISHGEFEVPNTPTSTDLAVGVRHLPPPPDTGYETSIGRSPDVWVDYVAGDADQWLNGSWAWLIPDPNSSSNLDNYNTNFASNNKRLHIQLGMCPWGGANRGGSVDNGAMLAQVAAGTHDSKWSQFATELKTRYPNLVNRPIYLGLGWEMNYSWSPWKVLDANKVYNSTYAANFAAAFRRIHDAVKNAESSVDWRFVFIPGSEAWRLSSWYPTRINQMYPGDNYVYAIGSDQYDGSGAGQYSDPPTNAQRDLVWNTEHLVALTNMNTFATQHNKKQVFGEWGIWHSIGSSTLGGDDNPSFIQRIYTWVTQHEFEHVAYFNRNVSNFVEHSLTSFGTLSKANARQAYIDTFGQHPHPF